MTSDESTLHTFATRLLPRRTPRDKPGRADLQLLAGRLPAGLPFELPVPSGSQIIGSAIEEHFAKIVLDTDLMPREVLTFYSVASHYASQTREAGCVEHDHGHGDVLAWSTWDLDHPDHGPSHGLVLIVQQPNDRTQYFLYLRVGWAVAGSQPQTLGLARE